MRARFALALLLAAPGCDGSTPADAGPDDAALDRDAGLDAGADAGPPPAYYALDGTDPALPTDDLAPFGPLLEGVDVVGIGESVHTTGGEIAMRARLIRYLVSELGFRVLALENPRIQTATGMAPFVERCEGTAEDAALYIDPIWWDRSTPALLQWLCDYNQEHPADPVSVIGADIREPWDLFRELEAFFGAAAPADAMGLLDGMRTCLGVGHADRRAFFEDPTVQGYFAGTATPQAEHDACVAGTAAGLAYLETNRAALVAASSERDAELARLAVVGLEAFDTSIFHLSRGDLAMANPLRDIAMADVLATLLRLDHPDARTIVFAHDGHIMSASHEVLSGQWRGVMNLTTILEAELGDRYAAIGQISRTTHIDWLDGAQTLEQTDESDLEQLLDGIGPAFLLVDTAAAVALDPPLWDPTLGYHVGFDTMLPANHYRALVYHRESPAADWFTPPPFAM